MKKITLFLLEILFAQFSYSQQTHYDRSSGIYFEHNTDTTNPARFTEDNIIYKANKIFVYSMKFYDSSGNNRYFKFTTYSEGYKPEIYKGDTIMVESIVEEWGFMDTLNNDSCVTGFKMFIYPDNKILARFDPSYNQTVIRYDETPPKQDEFYCQKTGLVENEKNIWIHPIRGYGYFNIMYINPYPYVKFPVKKNKRWRWRLDVGSRFGNSQWAEWEGALHLKYNYKITDVNKTLQTSLGDIQCCIIQGSAQSKIGKSFLTTYFNNQYGFVKQLYTNIDGSIVEVELIDIEIKK